MGTCKRTGIVASRCRSDISRRGYSSQLGLARVVYIFLAYGYRFLGAVAAHSQIPKRIRTAVPLFERRQISEILNCWLRNHIFIDSINIHRTTVVTAKNKLIHQLIAEISKEENQKTNRIIHLFPLGNKYFGKFIEKQEAEHTFQSRGQRRLLILFDLVHYGSVETTHGWRW